MFDYTFLDLMREYDLKYQIQFKVYNFREIGNRVVLIFSYNNVPIMSSYIDCNNLNIHGFAYKNQELCPSTIVLVKEITNKVRNTIVFEAFRTKK